jgi:hypothetical protein
MVAEFDVADLHVPTKFDARSCVKGCEVMVLLAYSKCAIDSGRGGELRPAVRDERANTATRLLPVTLTMQQLTNREAA